MIIDKHRDFARALVKLAREHRMSFVTAKFQLHWDVVASREAGGDPVDMVWREGRHGAESGIELDTRSFDRIREEPEHAVTGPSTEGTTND